MDRKKISPGIHLSYKLTKFQADLTIYAYPRVHQRFLVHLVSRTASLGPKNYNFQKMKNKPQRFTQALSVPNFRQIWQFIPSLEHPKFFRTYRHTDTDIDTDAHTYPHTIYFLRHPHAVLFLRNEMPFSLQKTPKTHAA